MRIYTYLCISLHVYMIVINRKLCINIYDLTIKPVFFLFEVFATLLYIFIFAEFAAKYKKYIFLKETLQKLISAKSRLYNDIYATHVNYSLRI